MDINILNFDASQMGHKFSINGFTFSFFFFTLASFFF